tara:strand:+ start:752 stop:1867 length:1116 start_codon:yes stop_codon:yes gene_type:complete
MEVVHLGKYYKPYQGGVEKVNSDLAESCQCFTVKVIAFDEKGSSYESSGGVEVFRSKVDFSVASAPISIKYLINVLRFSKNNILHVHMPNPFANFSIFLSFLVGRKGKLILHWHSDIVKQKKLYLFYRPLVNWLLDKADIVIATSPIYIEGSQQLKNHKDKCKVIPIGVDSLLPKVNYERVNKLKKYFNNKKIVFSLGRHIYYKGFSCLIDAASYISDDAVVVIGGNGEETQIYHEKITSMGLNDKVYLIGKIDDEELASYYYASEVFCLPSIEKSEAFGVVQIEAMSTGTPIVSTNITGSGVPWVNKDGFSGFVCNPNDAKDLADKVNVILSDDSVREELSLGARKRYISFFTKERMCQEFDAVYNSFLK